MALVYRYDLFSHSAYDKIFVSSSLFDSVDPSFKGDPCAYNLDLRFSFNVNIRLTGRGTYVLQLGLNFVFLE